MVAEAKVRNEAIAGAEGDLAKLDNELQLDLVQAGLDLAGIADPTPASDLASAGLALARGDYIGAGLSLISCIPYAGDALAKTSKGAKLLDKMNDLRRAIASKTSEINDLRKTARDKASAAARARKQRQAGKDSSSEAGCSDCAKKTNADNPSGTRSPEKGWSGERGNSQWTPDESTSYGRDLMEWQEKNGIKPGTPIEFKDGFPDFSPYAKHEVKIDMVGDPSDFTQANNAMKASDPSWQQPKGYTWHHVEDGQKMQLVPTEVNSVPHTGGAALAKEPGY